MNYTKFFTILFFAFAIASCDFGSSSSSNNSNNTNTTTEPSEKPTAAKPTKQDNWLVISGEQVGRIKATASGGDIYDLFGDDNVIETEIGLGEGEMTKGLLVFPNTKNELQVLFDDTETRLRNGQEMNEITSIKIKGEGSMWKTEEGIAVGTSMEELVKLNGKDFKFYGFEWDYAGRLANWDSGKLSEKLSVDLQPTNEEAVFPTLLGDQEFSTKTPKAKEAGLKVISMTISF